MDLKLDFLLRIEETRYLIVKDFKRNYNNETVLACMAQILMVELIFQIHSQ
jgi:hypothetical protein